MCPGVRGNGTLVNDDPKSARAVALEVLFREIDLYTNAIENLNSVAAIVVGFTLASAAELLGFLLLVAADHPATAAMISK
jgi:hypothetical protein